MTEPTMHDIAKGTTGAGDDDDDAHDARLNWNGRPWPTIEADFEPSVYCDRCGWFVNEENFCACGPFVTNADEFYNNEYVLIATAADIALASYIEANGGSIGSEPFTIEQRHVHDASCNGTLELSETRLCGFDQFSIQQSEDF